MSQNKGLLSFLPPPKASASTQSFAKTTISEAAVTSTTTNAPSEPKTLTATIVKPSASNDKSSSSTTALSKSVNQVQPATTKSQSEELPTAKKQRTEDQYIAPKPPVNFLTGISNYYDSDSDDSEDLDQIKPLEVEEDLISKKPTVNMAPPINIPVSKSYAQQQQQQINENDEEYDENEEEYNEDEEYDEEGYEGEEQPEDNTPSTSQSAVEQILKLQGGKRKHNEPIDIVDVNVNEIVKTNKEQLLKNMTKEELKPTRTFAPGVGRKRSQITYLAMMAREREQELKSAWAENKFSRKMARQKYGF
jgi:hypothetical protein